MSFALLGLRADADERAVRRAYARLLKQTRPDDDPVAFQRLHEAYRDCLAEIAERRAHRAWQEDDEDASASASVDASPGEAVSPVVGADPIEAIPALVPPPRVPAPGERIVPDAAAHDAPPATVPDDDGEAPPARPALSLPLPADSEPLTFALGDFLHDLLPRLHADTPADLRAWLSARPELYSIRLKQAITVDVLQAAIHAQPPPRALEELARFFGLDDVGPSGWWLRERIDHATETANLRARFQRRPLPRTAQQIHDPWADDQIDAELVGRPNPARSALLLLVPGMVSRTRARILELEAIGGDIAIEAMRPATRARYLALGDSHRFDLRRIGLSLLRTAVWGGGLVGGLHLLGANVATVTRLVLWVGAVSLAWQLLLVAGHRVGQQMRGRLGTWAHEAQCVGLLASGATALMLAGQSGLLLGIGYSLAVVAAIQALQRPRVVLGVLVLGVSAFAEMLAGAVLGGLPSPFGLPALAFCTLLPLALDRVLAWRSGRDPLEHAQDSRPLRNVLVVGLVLFAAAGVIAASLGTR